MRNSQRVSTPLEMVLPEAVFEDYNDALLTVRGKSFADIARENPRDAYELFKSMSQALVASTTEVVQGGAIASAGTDGSDVIQGVAYCAIDEILPDPDFEDIEVTISVRTKPEVDTIFPGCELDIVPVVSFRVEPPDLA